MATQPRKLSLLSDTYAVCRLGRDDDVPHWAQYGEFLSVTRTADELSIVCPRDSVPPDIVTEAPWRCLKLEGPLDFALVGVIAAITAPLADAGIGVFTISTYDTDYLLVKEGDLARTIEILNESGFPCG